MSRLEDVYYQPVDREWATTYGQIKYPPVPVMIATIVIGWARAAAMRAVKKVMAR